MSLGGTTKLEEKDQDEELAQTIKWLMNEVHKIWLTSQPSRLLLRGA
jgi:hypothetical protein